MKKHHAIHLLAAFAALPLLAQSAPAFSAPEPAESGRTLAYYQNLKGLPPKAGGMALVIYVESCTQFKAPELSLIRCKLSVHGGKGLKSYAGRLDFTDKAGKLHHNDLNWNSTAALKPGDTTSTQFDLNLEDYEADSFQWYLDGYTDETGKHAGKEPQAAAGGGEGDAVDTVCKQRGYAKK